MTCATPKPSSMGRLVVGMALARSSAQIVVRTPVLLIPGLVQAAALVAVMALVLRYGVDLDAPARGFGSARNLAVMAVAGLVSTVVGVVSGAVVVAITADRLSGGQSGLRDGLGVARKHLPALVRWSLLSATVGAVLRLIEERVGPVGRWVTTALGLSFSVGTILVVPVIVLESAGPVPALRRSVTLFRSRFGESIGGEVGLALASFVVLLGAGVLVAPLFAVSLAVGLVAVGLIVVMWLAGSSVLCSVFSVALHRVVVGLPPGGPFGDLALLYPPKGQGYPPQYVGAHSSWDAS